jgi:hypothetical protein
MKPCPFCKHPGWILAYRIYDRSWCVECTWCGARGPITDTMEKAIEWWNERGCA